MKETKTATLKAKFRSSKMWKDFRKKKMNEQDNHDLITGRKLYKGFNVHHAILTNDMDVYRDLSDSSHFIAVNKSTHEAIHWALDLIKHNGRDAFVRYVSEVLREAILNKYISREEIEELINND